jgi:hypothetical protein
VAAGELVGGSGAGAGDDSADRLGSVGGAAKWLGGGAYVPGSGTDDAALGTSVEPDPAGKDGAGG